jgi:hypothetical protein
LVLAALPMCVSGCALAGGCAGGPPVLTVRLWAPYAAAHRDVTSVRLCLEGGWCQTRRVPFWQSHLVLTRARYWLSFSGGVPADVTAPGSSWPTVLLMVTPYVYGHPLVRASAWNSGSPIACQPGSGGMRPGYQITARFLVDGGLSSNVPPLPVDPPRFG